MRVVEQDEHSTFSTFFNLFNLRHLLNCKNATWRQHMSSILVLDDVMDAGVMIKRILERKGHSVTVFTEEQEALDHLRDHGVDIAILDIKLKKISGVEVLKEMKSLSPQTDVLMLTGYPTLETAREALSLGAREYLVKPIDKAELESKIETILKDRESS